MHKNSGVIAVLAFAINATQTSVRLRAASPFVAGDYIEFDDSEAVRVVASNGPFLEVTRGALSTTASAHAAGEEVGYLDAGEIAIAVSQAGGAFTPGAVDTPTSLHVLEVVQQMRNALIANGLAVDSGS